MTRWRAVLLGIALAATIAAPDCAAPTLPIPPPTADPLSSPDAMGYVTITGQADSTAFVFALDENSQTGVISHSAANGRYTIRLQTATGDGVTVWQEIGNRPGQQLHLTIP